MDPSSRDRLLLAAEMAKVHDGKAQMIVVNQYWLACCAPACIGGLMAGFWLTLNGYRGGEDDTSPLPSPTGSGSPVTSSRFIQARPAGTSPKPGRLTTGHPDRKVLHEERSKPFDRQGFNAHLLEQKVRQEILETLKVVGAYFQLHANRIFLDEYFHDG
jgi:hypothetical protein